MRWLVTGGSGFIGSTFVRRLLAEPGVTAVLDLDLHTYAANPASNLELAGDPRFAAARADVADGGAVEDLVREFRPDFLVNLAAESHVDRSLERAWPFLHTNVLGTQALLDAWRRHPGRRFVQVSTDEVYGSLGDVGRFTEQDPLRPTSPYAASKAAGDLLVLGAVRTWGLDAVVTRCCNNLGPRQHPEKLVPRMVILALHHRPLPLYGTGRNVRDWIAVEDHAEALLQVALGGRAGRVYNVGASQERPNLEVVHRILDLLARPRSLVRPVADRPGHDWRYALDCGRIEGEVGWRPAHPFDETLARTVQWYVDHPAWWQAMIPSVDALDPSVQP